MVIIIVDGIGIVLLPSFIAHRAIAKGRLVQLLPQYRLPELNMYAIYPPTRHLSQRVRAFIDFLAERFGEEPYWDRELKLGSQRQF